MDRSTCARVLKILSPRQIERSDPILEYREFWKVKHRCDTECNGGVQQDSCSLVLISYRQVFRQSAFVWKRLCSSRKFLLELTMKELQSASQSRVRVVTYKTNLVRSRLDVLDYASKRVEAAREQRDGDRTIKLKRNPGGIE